jgi:hypothetical protein
MIHTLSRSHRRRVLWPPAVAGGGGGGDWGGLFDDYQSDFYCAWSMRQLFSDWSGALARMKRSTDNDEEDFGPAADGIIDLDAYTAWAAGTVTVVKWYDQTGNGYDLEQFLSYNLPPFTTSGENGRPCIAFDGSSMLGMDYFHNQGGAALDEWQAYISAEQDATDWNILLHTAAYNVYLQCAHPGASDVMRFAMGVNIDWSLASSSGWRVWTLQGDATSSYSQAAWENGASKGTSTSAGYQFNRMLFGGAGEGTFWIGDACELLLTNVHSSSRSAIEDLLMDFSGI